MRISILSIAIALCAHHMACASEVNSLFANYSRAEGLTHKFIYNIIRDTDGFIWIASSSGLSRFDSYTFENYENNTHSSNFLEGTAVYWIAEGKDKRIWLSTDAGLGFFDKRKERFSLIENHAIQDIAFKKDMSVDEQGRVWLFNQTMKFVMYDPRADSIALHIPDYTGWGVDSNFYIIHFLVANNKLWIGSNQGVGVYDIEKKTFSFIDKTPGKHCHTVRRADSNTIVMTYMQEGVFVVDIAKEKSTFIKKSYIDNKTGIKSSLFDAVVDADSTLWVSVSPGIVSIKNDEVHYYGFDSRQNYFSGDVASCMYRDPNNNLWVGTYGDGIFLKKTNNSSFKFTTRLFKGDVKKTPISSFSVFRDGSLLYRDSKGVYICPDYSKLSVDCARQIINSSASNLYPLDNRYAIISLFDTLFVYDSHSKSLTRSFGSLATACIHKDFDNLIWTGTWHGYLFAYDNNGKRKHEIAIDSTNNSSFPVTVICADVDGSFWLGTSGKGVVHVINPTAKRPTMEYFNKGGKDSFFLNSNTINCLFIDADGDLWIGTNGAGLMRKSKKTGEITAFTSRNGLKSNIIESITADNHGNIWFASVVLSKYNVKMGVFSHYSNVEGINSSFVPKACQKMPNGDLLFANTNGIYVFNPDEIAENTPTSTPLLTKLRIRGASVFSGDSIDGFIFNSQSITYSDELILPFAFNTFTLEFASIHFQQSQAINYEYMLDGIDHSWIPADTRTRQASYSGLQPGSYLFKVRASFGAGKWSSERVLRVDIIPPWWKSTWFKVISSFAAALSVILVFTYRTRALKRINSKLEDTVYDRTRELEIANKSLQESAQNLDVKNKNLEEHQMVIEMKNKDLLDALNTKDRLISLLGHDFKNPLTGLHGIATLLHKESEKLGAEKIKKYADNIIKVSTSLTNQMLMVLDWAQSHINNMQCHPTEVNMGLLLYDAISLLSENASQKNITLNTQIECRTNALADPRMISTVLRNLLGNAIKFTPRGGKIMLMIQEYENGINVTIIDTGIGMSEETQRVFKHSNEFITSTYGTDNEKGTGLGLQICKQFVEKNKGTITLSSTEGEGTVFTISLPKGATAILEEIIPDVVSTDNNTKGTHTVLIIDDDESVVMMLKSAFEEMYNVVIAKDGKEGLYIAQNILPNLIISDIGLPGLFGTDLCDTLKTNELTSHIPVILITSTGGIDIQNKSYLSGADDFIVKPLNVFALKQKSKSLIELQERFSTKQSQKEEPERTFLMPEDFDSKIVKKTLAYIHENISEMNLDTNSIADAIAVSRTQLWRIFKNSTGKSLGDVIREIRMQKAMEMIKTGKYRISEVAYEVGYSDARYFARCFTKVFGRSPTSFIEGKE